MLSKTLKKKKSFPKIMSSLYFKTVSWKDFKIWWGIPGWRSGLAPAFGPRRDPGDPGSNPTSGSRCMEPASPSACVSASLSLSVCVCVSLMNK